jgi:cytochrome c oxidase subunit 2
MLIYSDIAYPLQYGFQNPGTYIMENIELLHNHILFYELIILVLVTWLLFIIIYRYTQNKPSLSDFNHASLLEIIWTLSPGIVLILIALPSFRLLYLIDELIEPIITIKVIGHQWFWTYQYGNTEFESYLISLDSLENNQFRLLETDHIILLPINTVIRVIVSAADVLHSWGVPALGVKIDAIPGRLNQTSLEITRPGLFHGHCYELCGPYHGSMPIQILAI